MIETQMWCIFATEDVTVVGPWWLESLMSRRCIIVLVVIEHVRLLYEDWMLLMSRSWCALSKSCRVIRVKLVLWQDVVKTVNANILLDMTCLGSKALIAVPDDLVKVCQAPVSFKTYRAWNSYTLILSTGHGADDVIQSWRSAGRWPLVWLAYLTHSEACYLVWVNVPSYLHWHVFVGIHSRRAKNLIMISESPPVSYDRDDHVWSLEEDVCWGWIGVPLWWCDGDLWWCSIFGEGVSCQLEYGVCGNKMLFMYIQLVGVMYVSWVSWSVSRDQLLIRYSCQGSFIWRNSMPGCLREHCDTSWSLKIQVVCQLESWFVDQDADRSGDVSLFLMGWHSHTLNTGSGWGWHWHALQRASLRCGREEWRKKLLCEEDEEDQVLWWLSEVAEPSTKRRGGGVTNVTQARAWSSSSRRTVFASMTTVCRIFDEHFP